MSYGGGGVFMKCFVVGGGEPAIYDMLYGRRCRVYEVLAASALRASAARLGATRRG